MKLKRVLALALSASLFVSAPVMATGTTLEGAEVTATETEAEELTPREEAAASENAKKIVESTETVETTEAVEGEAWSGVAPTMPAEEADEEEASNELKNAEITPSEDVQEGVVPAEDAMTVENKESVDASATSEVDESGLQKSGEISITEAAREDYAVDLTKDAQAQDEVQELLNEETVSDDDLVRVIIVMDGDSIIEKDSEATLNWLTKIQMSLLEAKQNSVVSKIERRALDGEELEVRYHYTWLLNGIAAEIPYGAIEDIEAISGVEDVILQPVYETCDTTADPYTVADGAMIGREATWADGYTGEGIKIAIIDTGLDDDHQNFVALPEDKLTEDSATKDTVESVLGQLNASALYEGLTVDDVYRSTKVAYGFNYVDQNLRIDHSADSQGDHGTHVAGIAAANDLNNGEAVGVAPDAQLYVMKVFGANGGAYTEDLLAAVEDSLILGADVINMSLGSPAGFTSDGEALDEIYGRVSETNTILAIAAGNSSTMGSGNLWGLNTNLASNPDNSVVSSPATYVNATSVASVENVGNKGYYVEVAGTKLAYQDGSGGSNAAMVTLAGQTLGYAMVDNCGQSLEDFTNAGVEGKIAVVQRGLTAFSDKCQLAQDAGAVACIIYNNTSGTIGMDLSQGTSVIPCASITMKDGEYLAYAKEENADAEMYISDQKAVLASDTAYQMSDFSSWGVSPDLSLEPDVTAPGGNIYSTLDGGEYGVMSGTSMASPNMAGVSALVMQYAKENFPKMSASELHTFVNTLIVSTAEPLAYDETLDYSPRNQGAGLVNAYSAIKTNAYLTVDGVDVPKAELGDDPEKTGVYTYSFDVTNFGDTPLYYDLSTTSQTEGVYYEEYYDKNFMSMTPQALDASTSEASDAYVYTYDYNKNNVTDTTDARQLYLKALDGSAADAEDAFRYDVNSDEVIDTADAQAYLDALVGKDTTDADLTDEVLKVPAGKTATVQVTVNVTEEGKAYMDANFENGIYVEGFTTLTAKNVGGIDLSLPYLGFYGDWTQAPILDSGYYWQDDSEMEANQYYNILFTNYGSSDWVPGINPYLDEAFDESHISFSPNGDGYADYITDIYVSLLRNAKTLSFTYTDAETGEVYFENVVENVSKSYYVSSYGLCLPYVYSWYGDTYELTDAEGNTLPNDTKLTLSVKATVDYDEHESNNLSDEWETPITVDTEAPEITYAATYVDQETGKYYLGLTFSDNVAVAAVNFLNKSGTSILAQYPVAKEEGEDSYTMLFDITGFGEEFVVILGDYAMNESAYILGAEGNDPILDETLLYGYRVYDQNYNNDSLYGWIGIDKETAETDIFSSEYYVDYSLVAATYVGGMIVAVDANDDLVAIKPGYWDERTKITSLGTTVSQLAFDPTTATLYAYDKDNSKLVTIDLATGELKDVSTDYFSGVLTMACTDKGILYAVNSSGVLAVVDKETGSWGETVLNTYDVTKNYPGYAQSMAYDSATDSLYWARYYSSWYGQEGALYRISLSDNCEMTKIGTIAGNAEVVGLLTLEDNGYTLPEATLEKISMDQEEITLLLDGTQTLNVLQTPWYTESEDVIWSSEDENVATVNESGKVTGTGVGTTNVYAVTADGNFKAACAVKVVAPESDLTAFVMAGNTLYNQWISFGADAPEQYQTLSEQDFLSFYAGEYLDGYVYAYSSATELYKINPETLESVKVSGARNDCYMQDMAYDYSTGYMYGLTMDMYGSNLVVIDTLTGEFETVAQALMDEYYNTFISLAVATDGTMYLLSTTGMLYTYDVDNAALTRVGYTGYAASSLTQCLAYDHNTDELYWTMLSNTGASALMYLDTTTGKALTLGTIDAPSQISCMYVVPETTPERPEVAVESVTVNKESLNILQGANMSVPVTIRPYNATDRTITWISSDESVAVVENGMIIAKNPGTAVLTGTIGEISVTINVEVLQSAGALGGYILTDYGTGNGQFWGEFADYDLSSGNGLADASEYYLYAGEYYDGRMYGFGADAETFDDVFLVINRDTFEVEKSIACTNVPDVLEMAFDYSEGVMYAVAGVKNTASNTSLYVTDLDNGTLYKVASLDDRIMTLACTEDGRMYGVSEAGTFYEINKVTGELTAIGETGYGANQYQSMAYDYNTGNMYWAQAYYDSFSWVTSGSLFLVDVTDASLVNLGQIGTAGCQVSALHILPKKEMTVGTPKITGVALSQTDALLGVGDSIALTAKVTPISVVDLGATITFTSENPAVATVDADGNITAVSAGTAVIKASCGDVSASCIVKVLDDQTQLYVANQSGWEKSPVLQPGKIASSVELPEDSGLTIARACYNQDGYFYAIDTEGYLWKYTEDLVVVEKIGTQTVLAQLDNLEDFEEGTATFVDMAANPYTGEVYVLAYGISEYGMAEFYIYQLDLTTGEATAVKTIDYNIGNAAAFTFISENEVAIYDAYMDYVYSLDISSPESYSKQLAFVQFVVASGEHLSMTYSMELNQIFIATDDDYHNNAIMALYMLNPVTGEISKVANAAYAADLTSIFMVEGTAPATDVLSLDDDTEAEETEEVEEVQEETEATDADTVTVIEEEAIVEEDTTEESDAETSGEASETVETAEE